MATVRKAEWVAKECDVLVSDISGLPIPRHSEGQTVVRLEVCARNQGGYSYRSMCDIKSVLSSRVALDCLPEEYRDLMDEINEAIRRVKLKHQSRIIGGAQ
jgi:hypothetical protein